MPNNVQGGRTSKGLNGTAPKTLGLNKQAPKDSIDIKVRPYPEAGKKT